MGILGLLNYLKNKKCHHPPTTSLEQLVSAARKTKQRVTLLIDANAVSRFIAQNKPETYETKEDAQRALLAVLLSDYYIIRDRWCAFIRKLQDAGCRCIFYFESSSGDDRERNKLDDRHTKQGEFSDQSLRITEWLCGRRAVPTKEEESDEWINAFKELPHLVEMFLEPVCRSLGCEVKTCIGEADFELIADARRGANTYILSRDTDFLITSGIKYIPFHSLDVGKRGIPCQVYTSRDTAKILDIPESRLAEFAFLAGNDYSEHLVWTKPPTNLSTTAAPPSSSSPVEYKRKPRDRIDDAIEMVMECEDEECIEDQYQRCFTNDKWVNALATTRQLHLPSSSSSSSSLSSDEKGELTRSTTDEDHDDDNKKESARAMRSIHERLCSSQLPITTLMMTNLATVIQVTAYGDAASFPATQPSSSSSSSSPPSSSLLWHTQVVLPVERAMMRLSGRSSCHVLSTNYRIRELTTGKLRKIDDIVTATPTMWDDHLVHALNNAVVTKQRRQQQQQSDNSISATESDGLIEAKTIASSSSSSLCNTVEEAIAIEHRKWFVDHDQQIVAKNVPLVYTPFMDRDTKVALWALAWHSYPALESLSSSVESKDVAATSPAAAGLSLVTSIDHPRLLSLRVPIICWRGILAAHIEHNRPLPEYLVDVFLFTSALLSVLPTPPQQINPRLLPVTLLPAKHVWLPPAATATAASTSVDDKDSKASGAASSAAAKVDKVSDTIMLNFFTVLTQISYAYQMSHELAGMLDMDPSTVRAVPSSSSSSSSSSLAAGMSDMLPFVGPHKLFAPNRSWTLLCYLLTNKLSLATLTTPSAVSFKKLAAALGVSPVKHVIVAYDIFLAAKRAILQPFGAAAPAWTIPKIIAPVPPTISVWSPVPSPSSPSTSSSSTNRGIGAAAAPKIAVTPSSSSSSLRSYSAVLQLLPSTTTTPPLSYAAALSGHSQDARVAAPASSSSTVSSSIKSSAWPAPSGHKVPRCLDRLQCAYQKQCKYYHTTEETATWQQWHDYDYGGGGGGGSSGDHDSGGGYDGSGRSHDGDSVLPGVTVSTPSTDTATVTTPVLADIPVTTHQAANQQHDSSTPASGNSSDVIPPPRAVKKKLRARASEFVPSFEVASSSSNNSSIIESHLPLSSSSLLPSKFVSVVPSVVAWPIGGRVQAASSSHSSERSSSASEQQGTIKAVTWDSDSKQWHVSVTWDGNDIDIVREPATLKLMVYPDGTPVTLPLATSGSSNNSNGHDTLVVALHSNK